MSIVLSNATRSYYYYYVIRRAKMTKDYVQGRKGCTFFLFVVSDTFFFRLQLADELLPRYNWIEFVRNMYMRWVMNKPMVMIIVDGQQQQQQHLTWTLHSLINALLCFFRKHQTIQPQNELNSKKVWFI